MGSAIGQFVSLPYTHAILDATGWVTSLLVLAGTAALMAPLAIQLGREGNAAPHAGWVSTQGLESALREALRYPSFLLLTAGFFVCGFHIAAVAVHLPAFLADRGFGAGLGAIALTVVGGANILGTYAFGRIGDIVPKRLALAFIYLARAAIFIALIYLPLTESSVLIFSFFTRAALARNRAADERARRDVLRAALAFHALRYRVSLPSTRQLHGSMAGRLVLRYLSFLRSLVVGVCCNRIACRGAAFADKGTSGAKARGSGRAR